LIVKIETVIRHRIYYDGMWKKILCCAATALVCLSCTPRVSYSVRTTYIDAWFSGRNLSNAAIALLPVQSAKGAVVTEELESEKMVVMFQKMRRDLQFASSDEFESGFPAQVGKAEIAEFYRAAFSEDILSVKSMDSIWKYVRQPYILVFSLAGGASVNGMDGGVFKQVSVRGDLWSRDGREVVWRSVCKGVSDDRTVDDSRLIAESVQQLAEALPKARPNYGRESW